MKRTRIVTVVILAALGCCARDEIKGPPDLRLGRDECGECGMIISEDRSSCAFVIDNRGRRDHMLFDDVGCMLDVEREGRHTIHARYVRDHATGAWVPAETATFVFADRKALPTPMGSGIAAFADRSGAEAVQQKVGGKILNYTDLMAARKAWMEERYGKPQSAG